MEKALVFLLMNLAFSFNNPVIILPSELVEQLSSSHKNVHLISYFNTFPDFGVSCNCINKLCIDMHDPVTQVTS